MIVHNRLGFAQRMPQPRIEFERDAGLVALKQLGQQPGIGRRYIGIVFALQDQDRKLKPFLLKPCTVSQAAAELDIGITPMFKRLQRLLRLGLVEEVGQTRRAGRAIRHYRAIAKWFLVPFKLYPPELIGEPNRRYYLERLEQNIQRLYRSERMVEEDLGLCTAFTEAGEIYLEIVNKDGRPWDYLYPQAPAILSGWNPIQLDFADAKAFQHELSAVMLKYLNKGGSHTYLSGIFLVEMQQG